MIYLQIYWSFFKIGALTFGGGYAMLPMIEREIVRNRKWASNEDVIDIFAVSQSLPGAIALNSATQIGYRVKGVLGGVVAMLGAVTPSLIIITLIATVLSLVWGNAILTSAFAGIGVAVCAMILNTVIKFLKTSVVDVICGIIFAAVLVCSLAFKLSPFIYILIAIALGIGIGYIRKNRGKGESEEKPEEFQMVGDDREGEKLFEEQDKEGGNE